MWPMIDESLSVIIQGENSQRIFLTSNNRLRRCRRHMRTRLKLTFVPPDSFISSQQIVFPIQAKSYNG